MKLQTKNTRVQKTLLRWFSSNRRDLPWRRTRDPYLIAVSEVMLQQTQVERVVPKFLAWRRAWPTTASLARAPLRDVLTLWSGLGYNSRAMRLRDTARMVMGKFHGHWPRTVEELEVLPGFGPYTARAVASFAYHQDVPAMDTNIRRVVSRIFFGVGDISETKLKKKVAELVPDQQSAAWHAALMDFGSAVCTSRKPACSICPVRHYCRAYPDIGKLVNKKNKLSAKFQSTDRYWRGEIVRHFIRKRLWTTIALHRSLQQVGKIDQARVIRLMRALSAHRLLVQHGQGYVLNE